MILEICNGAGFVGDGDIAMSGMDVRIALRSLRKKQQEQKLGKFYFFTWLCQEWNGLDKKAKEGKLKCSGESCRCLDSGQLMMGQHYLALGYQYLLY